MRPFPEVATAVLTGSGPASGSQSQKGLDCPARGEVRGGSAEGCDEGIAYPDVIAGEGLQVRARFPTRPARRGEFPWDDPSLQSAWSEAI